MINLLLIRRFASVLLALCFVLPLSMCSSPQPVNEQGKVVQQETHLSGQSMALDYLRDVKDDRLAEGIGGLAILFGVFFLPLACLAAKNTLAAILVLLAAAPAGYALVMWVFAFSSRAEYGGILALGAWALLLAWSIITLWRRWRARQQGATV